MLACIGASVGMTLRWLDWCIIEVKAGGGGGWRGQGGAFPRDGGPCPSSHGLSGCHNTTLIFITRSVCTNTNCIKSIPYCKTSHITPHSGPLFALATAAFTTTKITLILHTHLGNTHHKGRELAIN